MSSAFPADLESRLLGAFHRAAASVPAYRALLAEHGVAPDRVTDLAAFVRFCPLLHKANTFGRFPVAELCAGGTLGDLAGVLTSSGHGGSFSFGLIDRRDIALHAAFTDRALDEAFGIASRLTLAINCLPMGVVFSSNRMTMATTSVREDMAVALVQAFGAHYEQILLVADPLFLKRLLDHAAERDLDWSRHRLGVVLGEEIFGERFRTFAAAALGLDADDPSRGYLMSSFGVGELGLHLCYETPTTIALRRAAFATPALARALFGPDVETTALPVIFTFDPMRTFVEIADADPTGDGRLTFSLLDAELSLPLLRYQTGDVARLLDAGVAQAIASAHGVTLPSPLPSGLLALKGRDKETLPNGSHVGVYKDALYGDHDAARAFTGACRLTFEGRSCTMHVQLRHGVPTPHTVLEDAIVAVIPAAARPDRVELWPYAAFPFGMGLDYERKFTYYDPRHD